MTLYEINNAIMIAVEMAVNPDTGEIVDDAVMKTLDQLKLERDEKIENVALYIKNLKADADAIRNEEKALAARRKSAENRAESLRNYLAFCLDGQKFTSPRAAVSFRKSKKVEIDLTHFDDIPETYLRYQEPEVDKVAVKKAIENGEEVPACRLVDNVSIIIK